MLSGPALIVLGQSIILGLSPDGTTSDANGNHIPGISNPLLRNLTRRDDYTYTPGIGGHKVHTELTTWTRALKICRDEGAHLTIINGEDEANAVASLITAAGPIAGSYDSDYLWAGIQDFVGQDGNWETLFGDSLSDAGFDEWHGDKSVDNALCGAVYKDGRYSWFSCARKLGFVCEVPDGKSCTLGDGTVTQEASWWIRQSLKKVFAQE